MLLEIVTTITNAVFCLATKTVFLRNSIPHNNHDQVSHLLKKNNNKKKDKDFLTE